MQERRGSVGECIWHDTMMCQGGLFLGKEEVLLWWRVLDEVDALLDVALEALDASLQELLLLFGHTAKNVNGLLGAVGL